MKKMFILCFIALFLLVSCNNENEDFFYSQQDTKNYSFVVEIKGKVRFPGIYEFHREIYMYELIDAAGGFLDTADKDSISMVQTIKESCTIIIRGKTESNSSKELININYANVELLITLPNIGTSTANKIIEYRNTHGLFKKIEDIMNVSGIKENIFNEIKDKITV